MTLRSEPARPHRSDQLWLGLERYWRKRAEAGSAAQAS